MSQEDIERLIYISGNKLEGDLVIPSNPKAIILFAHGAGSSRHSTRNQYVARAFNREGFATLLVDLLNPQEKEVDEITKHVRFDIDLLADRLLSVTAWISEEPETRGLKIGYFGSSTGAAATLISAAKLGDTIKAIVCRGGRPDLAVPKADLDRILAATLFIVGGNDTPVIAVNKSTLKMLSKARAREMAVVSGAGHLFEEPGKMEQVAKIAADWFSCHLLAGEKKFENRYRNKSSGLLALLKERPQFKVRFKDRAAAGHMLSSLLGKYKNDKDVIVVGIARGGIVVAGEVARKLNATLGMVVCRRLRTPEHSEKAIGAVMQDGYTHLDQRLVESLGISKEYLELERSEQLAEIGRKPELYGSVINKEAIAGKKLILVDDGAATGATIITAARWLRNQEPRLLVIGLPIAPNDVATSLTDEADQVEVISIPPDSKFGAVEQYYDDFSSVPDSEILQIVQEKLRTERRVDPDLPDSA